MDILQALFSKWVGNEAHILSFIFNSVSSECCKVWILQIPFFILLGHCSSEWGLSLYSQKLESGKVQNTICVAYHSLQPMRCGKIKTGFCFNIQKQPGPDSNGTLWQRSLTLKLDLRITRKVGNHLVLDLAVKQSLRRKEAMGVTILIFTVYYFITIVLISCAGRYSFLGQWESITSSRFVLNVVKGHHLQLRCCPPLFCNLSCLKLKLS